MTTAAERRQVVGAMQRANESLADRVAAMSTALTENESALKAALDYITAIENENDKLRQLVVTLAGSKGTRQ